MKEKRREVRGKGKHGTVIKMKEQTLKIIGLSVFLVVLFSVTAFSENAFNPNDNPLLAVEKNGDDVGVLLDVDVSSSDQSELNSFTSGVITNQNYKTCN